MDVDFKTPQDENSAVEDSVQNSAPIGDTNGSANDNGKPVKLKRGRTRSRSSTPQKKIEEQKTLHISIMKIENELNGKDLTEETEKTDEKIDAKDHDKEKADISKEKTDKVEELGNKEEQSKKQNGNTQKDEEKPKEDKLKKAESPKKDVSKKDVSKKDTVTKKIGTPKKDSPKKDSPKRDLPKKGSSPKQKNESPKREKRDRAKKQESTQPSNETETVEMDPLVISDEPDPELEFDETSDLESGKGSPIFARCITRRSQTRNIPTPKTPKSIDQDIDSEKNSSTYTPTDMIENDVDVPKTDSLNDIHDSTETTDISTRVEVGSDSTRMAYVTHDSNFTDDSYLNASRERSLGETLRSLSARRPIRSTEDYRKRVLRINQDKSDLNMPYASRNSVEQISSGVKRKSRSSTPEERKKFKGESPVVNSIFSSPMSNFRNRFRSDLPSSTPKLLGYKETSGLHYSDEEHFAVQNGDDEKKSWCSIM